MNIQRIKDVVNSAYPQDVIEQEILKVLAEDENAIPMIMAVLSREREIKKELIAEMNLELSRAHIYIDERPESKAESAQNFNRTFLLDKISAFYIKYKKHVTHCFNRFNDAAENPKPQEQYYKPFKHHSMD